MLVLLVLVLSPSLFAQTSVATGSVVGTVTDCNRRRVVV
jgi:hypothetical protein